MRLRQCKGKLRATSPLAVDAERAAMRVHDSLCDCQAKPGATGGANPGATFHRGQVFEDMRQISRLDAFTRVADHNHHSLRSKLGIDHHVACWFGARTQRVRQQIVQHALHQASDRTRPD